MPNKECKGTRMQVKELENKGLKRKYQVVVPWPQIKSRVDNELRAIGGRAKIPGFRPGHVPLKLLEQRYGKAVLKDVLEGTVKHSTQEVFKQHKLRPAMQPSIDVKDFSEGGDFEYVMDFEIFPEIPAIDYKKIEIEKLAFSVAAKDVDEGVARLTENHKENKPFAKTKKSELGHTVRIDFLGKKDGTPFEGGEAKDFQLSLGSGQFIPGFEDQIVGMKAGDEKIIKVTFPKEYHSADLAGAKAEFDVTVHEVMEAVAPKLDDAFAESIGFESLKALKEAVKAHLESEYVAVTRNKMKRELFDWLEENCKFTVPESMLSLEFDAIWNQVQEAKKAGDPAMDKPEKELKKEYEEVSERRVRLGMILAETANVNKLQVNQDDINNALLAQARQYPGQEQQIIEHYRQHPEHIEELKGTVLEEKAVDFLLDNVKVKEKKVDLEELLTSEEEAPKKKPKSSTKKPAAKKETAKKAPAKKAASKKTTKKIDKK
jgi:trigger factor